MNEKRLRVFHADSLAGPMSLLKKGFEVSFPGTSIELISGRSKELAMHILQGEICDVFAPSDPEVISGQLFGQAAEWLIVFSRNEMVLATQKGNPLGIKNVSDLAQKGVKWVRVTGERDLATGRIIQFINRAAQEGGMADESTKIIETASMEANTIPEAVGAIVEGNAHAGIVYLSAAVVEKDSLDIISFPPHINLSNEIQNAITIPNSSLEREMASEFVRYVLSQKGQSLLHQAGQPPVIEWIQKGNLPTEIQDFL